MFWKRSFFGKGVRSLDEMISSVVVDGTTLHCIGIGLGLHWHIVQLSIEGVKILVSGL